MAFAHPLMAKPKTYNLGKQRNTGKISKLHGDIVSPV